MFHPATMKKDTKPGLCIGKNLSIRCVSRYRSSNTIYCNILQYYRHDDILSLFTTIAIGYVSRYRGILDWELVIKYQYSDRGY